MKNNGVMKRIYLYFREKTEKGEFSSKKMRILLLWYNDIGGK